MPCPNLDCVQILLFLKIILSYSLTNISVKRIIFSSPHWDLHIHYANVLGGSTGSGIGEVSGGTCKKKLAGSQHLNTRMGAGVHLNFKKPANLQVPSGKLPIKAIYTCTGPASTSASTCTGDIAKFSAKEIFRKILKVSHFSLECSLDEKCDKIKTSHRISLAVSYTYRVSLVFQNLGPKSLTKPYKKV